MVSGVFLQMDSIVYLFAIGTFFSTLVGGLFAVRFRHVLPYFFAFSAGTLIGVSFFDLLPESLDVAQKAGFSFREVMLVLVASFLFYHLLERFLLTHHHDEDGHAHIMGPIGAGSLIVHSFFDGAAIGAAFQVDPRLGLVVALAVLFHDFTDGINTVTLMLKNKHHVKNALIFLLLDSAAPVLGVLATFFISINETFLAVLLAFFVGEFLYIGTGNLLPETQKHSNNIFSFTIFGVLLIYILTSFL